MAQVTPTIKYYAYLNGAWVELDWSAETTTVKQGILSNDAAARIAHIGKLEFTLNNDGDIYTPGHSSAISGWKNGVKIKQVITYDGDDFPSLWHIEPRKGIQIDVRPYGTRKAKITALDWMDYASKAPVGIVPVLSDFTTDAVIESLTEGMAQPPANTSLDTGVNTFESALDTAGENASVYSELSKLALSEWGYIYVRPDTTDGETLHFENAHHRNGLVSETAYESTTFYAETIPFDAEVTNGDNVINSVKIYAYPTRRDDSAVVLFELAQPFMIASGQTYTLRGSYADPDGGKSANGFDMISPVATTDYLANDASDGSGTDRTASISVAPFYGANGFEHRITNGYAGNIWITKFNCRGYGIYVENQINYLAQDTEKVDEVGVVQKNIYQKYQKTLEKPESIAESILFFEKEPETRIDSIEFYANRSDAAMKAFLNLGIGDMIRIESTKGGIDAYHFIQGIEYQILPGRIIKVKWIVKQFLSLALGLSLLGCSFGALSDADMVDYGVVPEVNNLETKSISFWIYMTQHPPSASGVIISNYSEESGWIVYAGQATQGAIFLRQNHDTDDGIWSTPASAVSLGEWTHVLITRDTSTPTNEPIIYINGVSQTITELVTPSGDATAETDNHLMVGNYLTSESSYTTPFYGYICGSRIYDAVLDAAAGTALYNAGHWDTNTETDNLVWQGGCFRSRDIGLFDGAKYLTTEVRTVDNINQYTAQGHGYPTPFTDTSSPEYINSMLHFDFQEGAGSATLVGSSSGTIIPEDGTIIVPANADLMVFATKGNPSPGVPVLGGTATIQAVETSSAGHYAGLYYLADQPAGTAILTGCDAYWWAVQNSSGILVDTDAGAGPTTLTLNLQAAGANLTFCNGIDYFDGNLEISQTSIAEDYDGSYDGYTVILGRRDTGDSFEDISITRTGAASTSRNPFVAASWGYSAVGDIIDETGKTWTASGNAAISETTVKYGNGALVLDGTNDTYISTSDDDDFHLSDEDWTFDFWINFTFVSTPTFATIFSQHQDADNQFVVRYNTSTDLLQCFQYESSAYVWLFTAPWTPTADTWYHVVFERDGNTARIFVDGAALTVTETVAISGKTAANLTGDVVIGAQNNANRIIAKIDEFRYSLGVARWSEDFTPPASKYAA